MMMMKANGTGTSPSEVDVYPCTGIAQSQWAFPCVLRNHWEAPHFELQYQSIQFHIQFLCLL